MGRIVLEVRRDPAILLVGNLSAGGQREQRPDGYGDAVEPAVTLASLTTLGLGGPAPRFSTATDIDEVRDAILDPDVLIIGGGSNLVVADAGVPGPVVRIGVEKLDRQVGAGPDGSDLVTLGAGVDWDMAVAELTADGYGELAPLSGIPGSVGATPVQNVGAYGIEVAEILDHVTVVDRATGELQRMTRAELGLGYRSSVLRGTDRAVVVAVTFRLSRSASTVRYAELARLLDVRPGAGAPPDRVREAVLGLRRSKGMVLDPTDPDTRSAGSFFTNPILEDAGLQRVTAKIEQSLGAISFPAYPAAGRTKLSAAWLIERAGFHKGFAGPGGRVAVSSKHTLALTNRGGASTEDLLTLAREIRAGVEHAFGVRLEAEPVMVGVSFG